MQDSGAWLDIAQRDGAVVLAAGGRWLVTSAAALDRELRAVPPVAPGSAVRIDLSAVERLDTAGAWLVLRTCRELEHRGAHPTIENLPRAFAPLFEQVVKGEPTEHTPPAPPGLAERLGHRLELVGRAAVEFAAMGRDLLGFVGQVTTTLLAELRRPGRVRFTAMVAQTQRTGTAALPIIGLLSFLVGVVLAYQGADQLRRFGAEIFAVNLLGIGILRELGVLLTAIIVAGRSGSAFTAELGAMQVNEEIDALRTLGLNPIEVLVLPRLFGLILALPLLAFYANVMALLGGAMMSWAILGISPPLFLRQLHEAIDGWTLALGLVKAPFFAATIALVGCHAGLRVQRSAASVGRLTTFSVVQSIFLVIILDAAFSILYARLHL
jgi:phospholipid/cholesterol/gamma-HCH transport system permease protein